MCVSSQGARRAVNTSARLKKEPQKYFHFFAKSTAVWRGVSPYHKYGNEVFILSFTNFFVRYFISPTEGAHSICFNNMKLPIIKYAHKIIKLKTTNTMKHIKYRYLRAFTCKNTASTITLQTLRYTTTFT